jgi:uncharacterized membrane protein
MKLFNDIPQGKQGRYIGMLTGLVIGVLIIIPKIIWLLILVAIGYFIGNLFDKGRDEEIIQ